MNSIAVFITKNFGYWTILLWSINLSETRSENVFFSEDRLSSMTTAFKWMNVVYRNKNFNCFMNILMNESYCDDLFLPEDKIIWQWMQSIHNKKGTVVVWKLYFFDRESAEIAWIEFLCSFKPHSHRIVRGSVWKSFIWSRIREKCAK